MSHSTCRPRSYRCSGAMPGYAKVSASRYLRRAVRRAIYADWIDVDFVHPMDRSRGRAGSKMWDWGFGYYGDGRMGPHRLARLMAREPEWTGWVLRCMRK
jgi:hypothetical protein